MSLLAWNQLKQSWEKTQKTLWMIRPWSLSSWNRWLPLEGVCVFGEWIMIYSKEFSVCIQSDSFNSHMIALWFLRLHSSVCLLLRLLCLWLCTYLPLLTVWIPILHHAIGSLASWCNSVDSIDASPRACNGSNETVIPPSAGVSIARPVSFWWHSLTNQPHLTKSYSRACLPPKSN